MSDATFKDAEEFLDELGVERRPLVVELPDDDRDGDSSSGNGTPDGGPASADVSDGSATSEDPADHAADPPPLDEAVSDAVATIRRITANTPASEGRVRRKLEQRELPRAVIDAAMDRARSERLVDDDALAAALVAEWRAKGHAPRRLRADLRKREFDEGVVERAVAVAEDDEPLAAAFALAKDRAKQMRHVEAETAFRRIVGYLGRRGHGPAIARKAARDAVFDDRERERTAGR